MVSELFVPVVVWGSVSVVAASTLLAWRHRPRPGATAFAVTMLAATWWVSTSAIGLYTTDAALRLFWAKVEWAGIATFPVAWLAFALAYTGRSRWLRPERLAVLAALPAVTLVLALTNGVGHSLVYRSTSFEAFGDVGILFRTFGPWYWVHVGYSLALLVAGAGLVVSLATQRRLLYRGQATALVLVVAPPLVGTLVYVTGHSPVSGFDPTPFTFVISGAAGLAALSGFAFLDAVPVASRVAHRSVVDELDAGVLVTDTTGHVVEANPRAETLLGAEGSLVGDPVTSRLPTAVAGVSTDGNTADGSAEESRSTDGGTRAVDGDPRGGSSSRTGDADVPTASTPDGAGSEHGSHVPDTGSSTLTAVSDATDVPELVDSGEAAEDTALVALDRDGRTRYYEVDVTALTDAYDNVTGRVYLVRDVTDRRARLQRVNVLNRVLRHNLRNEMNVVYGFADSLEHGGDPEELAGEIREKARDLVELSDKAREVDAVLDGADRETTDLCRVVDIECDRVAEEHSGVATDVETPDRPVRVDAVAGIVVRNLVENAAVHNSDPDPWLAVTVTVDDGRVTVRVADNGPGIPDMEREAFEADAETQLDHASGLGLWVATWGVASVGGSLDLVDRDGGGTVATAAFPLREDPGG